MAGRPRSPLFHGCAHLQPQGSSLGSSKAVSISSRLVSLASSFTAGRSWPRPWRKSSRWRPAGRSWGLRLQVRVGHGRGRRWSRIRRCVHGRGQRQPHRRQPRHRWRGASAGAYGEEFFYPEWVASHTKMFTNPKFEYLFSWATKSCHFTMLTQFWSIDFLEFNNIGHDWPRRIIFGY